MNAALPDGRRFLDVVVELCRTCGADPVVAVVPPDVAVPDGVRAVLNPRATDEQVTSLRLGLAQLANTTVDGVLVWPVDHPFATALSGMAVVDAARRTKASIVVPAHEGKRGHPVWFGRETWRELMTVADGGARAVVHAYQSACTQIISRYDGHIAQYAGDGLLVYFGYPHAHENDAERALRNDDKTKDIPVVLVTAKDQKADMAWGQMLGAKGYITKPYTDDQILTQARAL